MKKHKKEKKHMNGVTTTDRPDPISLLGLNADGRQLDEIARAMDPEKLAECAAAMAGAGSSEYGIGVALYDVLKNFTQA